MPARFVLVHSPSVGPATWGPVAESLRRRGFEVCVPSLLGVGAAGPPFWPAVVGAVRAELDDGRSDGGPEQLVLVAHSNAGLFVPVLASSLGHRVVGAVFVDAALPARSGPSPAIPEGLLEKLRAEATPDGLLPRWTDWWDPHEIATLFPDLETAELVTAEQPRLPLAYFEHRIPVPEGWDERLTCCYVLFGPPYDEEADEAASRGMAVERLPGLHLHQLVDADGVAELLVSFEERLPAS